MKDRLRSPWAFFLATFAWSWLFWGIAILSGANMETGEGIGLLLIGVTAPTLMGVAFTWLTRGRDERLGFVRRIISVRRIPLRWWAVILLSVPALNGLAILLDIVTGGGGNTWGEAATGMLSNPLTLLSTIMFALIVPFLEELGWRGYVLDRLVERRSALAANLILSLIWAAWHLPLFFVEGSYQAGLGVGTLEFWLFMLGIVPLGVVFGWVYFNTRRSSLRWSSSTAW